MRHWKNKNFDKYFGDDEYDNEYDPEEDYERYIDEMEFRYELDRDNKRTD